MLTMKGLQFEDWTTVAEDCIKISQVLTPNKQCQLVLNEDQARMVKAVLDLWLADLG